MTLKQMLALANPIRPGPPPPKQMDVPPGARIKNSALEPWMREQLDLANCPVCAASMDVFTSRNGVTHYTCQENVMQHRFSILDNE